MRTIRLLRYATRIGTNKLRTHGSLYNEIKVCLVDCHSKQF